MKHSRYYRCGGGEEGGRGGVGSLFENKNKNTGKICACMCLYSYVHALAVPVQKYRRKVVRSIYTVWTHSRQLQVGQSVLYPHLLLRKNGDRLSAFP